MADVRKAVQLTVELIEQGLIPRYAMLETLTRADALNADTDTKALAAEIAKETDPDLFRAPAGSPLTPLIERARRNARFPAQRSGDSGTPPKGGPVDRFLKRNSDAAQGENPLTANAPKARNER